MTMRITLPKAENIYYLFIEFMNKLMIELRYNRGSFLSIQLLLNINIKIEEHF